MGWLFAKKDEESSLHHMFSAAFNHVRNDFHHVFSWLNYFNEKHKSHDLRLDNLEKQIKYMPKDHEDIKKIIDYHYSYDSILSKIKELNQRISDIELKHNSSSNTSSSPAFLRQGSSTGLKDRLLKRITKNSKEYVKSVILSLIKKYEKINGSQLREMIVEEQGLCSKSSFYRLLSEIETDGDISSKQEGKEKIYSLRSSYEDKITN